METKVNKLSSYKKKKEKRKWKVNELEELEWIMYDFDEQICLKIED